MIKVERPGGGEDFARGYDRLGVRRMYADTGILTALLQRQTTGRGAVVEVSMLEAMAEWMSQPMYFAAYGRQPTASDRGPTCLDRLVRPVPRGWWRHHLPRAAQ